MWHGSHIRWVRLYVREYLQLEHLINTETLTVSTLQSGWAPQICKLSVRSHTLVLKCVAVVYVRAETSTCIHLTSTHTLFNVTISSDVLFISHFQILTKASLCMKRSICHRWCITKKRSPATIDTYTARITWYMQRNYPADILREKARAEEYHQLWSLFDCSFHVSSYATCAHAGCRMRGVDRPSHKNKE